MQLPIIEPDPTASHAAASQASSPPAAPCCARHEAGSLGWTCPMHPEVSSPTAGGCPICGMPLEAVGEGGGDDAGNDTRRRLAWSIVPAVAVFLLAMLPMLGHLPGVASRLPWLAHVSDVPWVAWAEGTLATFVVFYGGWPILRGGIAGFRRGRPTMFSLITLGVLTAWGYSLVATLAPQLFPEAFRGHGGSVARFYESAAMIVVLVMAGQLLESRARRGTTAAIRSLLDLSPPEAERLDPADSNRSGAVPLAAVRRGDLLRVRPGGRVPVDGTLLEGSTECDESLLTGEPLPVPKQAGDRVLGGSLNGSGGFTMRAEVTSAASLVARITRLVREAHATRAPIEQLADRLSAWFVPAVLVVAAVTFLAWVILAPANGLAMGLVSAVSVLVIACPCGLGLATPLSMTVAIGCGARSGILARSSAAMQALASADTVVFDKTGTLTLGQPRIVAAGGLAGGSMEPADAFRLAAAVEAGSEHALARGFREKAAEEGRALPEARRVRAMPGMGVTGEVEGRAVTVGSHALFAERFGGDHEPADAVAARERGATVVFVAIEDEPAAWFAIEDTVRPEAASVVAALREAGLTPAMLSGDTQAAAEYLGRSVGIDACRGGCSPGDKLREIHRRREAGERMAFVGDGINDAPALAAADVGIAVGSAADVALETADITLLSGGLSLLPDAVKLSRATMQNVRENLALSLIYNVLAIPVAAGLLFPATGWLMSPMLAAAAMTGSSLSVIANALRLRMVARQDSGTTRPS